MGIVNAINWFAGHAWPWVLCLVILWFFLWLIIQICRCCKKGKCCKCCKCDKVKSAPKQKEKPKPVAKNEVMPLRAEASKPEQMNKPEYMKETYSKKLAPRKPRLSPTPKAKPIVATKTPEVLSTIPVEATKTTTMTVSRTDSSGTVSETQTKREVITGEMKTSSGVGYYSDPTKYERTGAKVVTTRTTTTKGQFDENEVQNALLGLKSAMDEQKQMDHKFSSGND